MNSQGNLGRVAGPGTVQLGWGQRRELSRPPAEGTELGLGAAGAASGSSRHSLRPPSSDGLGQAGAEFCGARRPSPARRAGWATGSTLNRVDNPRQTVTQEPVACGATGTRSCAHRSRGRAQAGRYLPVPSPVLVERVRLLSPLFERQVMSSYPRYATYGRAGIRPSVLSQSFPKPSPEDTKKYYQNDSPLTPHFGSENEAMNFGAARFCAFLDDTIEVEQCLVIPSIVSLRRLGYDMPPTPTQDLFKTVTDEGYHAEQALQYARFLRAEAGLLDSQPRRAPLFLRRLDNLREREPEQSRRDLMTVINGIVTETRIGFELDTFARDDSLAESAREICRTHAEDETIHASQFKALGRWLWHVFDDDTRAAAADFFIASAIARSMPDVDSIATMVYQATSLSLQESRRLVYSVYTEQVLIDQMMAATRATVIYLRHLGVEEYASFSLAVERERERLGAELAARRAAVGGRGS